jgi:acyl-coenzyme A thioesterase PaaI-like protein
MPSTSHDSPGPMSEPTLPEAPRRMGTLGRPWSGGGREEMATAVRRLMQLTVTSTPAPGAFGDAAARIEALCDELAAEVPTDGPEPVGRFAEESVGSGELSGLTAAMPFDMVVGSCNPVAPPIELWFDPPKAFGKVVFSPQYEGAPGCVHGAAIAAAFDIILTAANVVADAAGPTVELTIRYLKPTIVGVDTEFESEVTEVTNRRTHSVGRLIQGGVVKVEATGEFVNLSRDRINAMHRDRVAGDAEARG